MGGGFRGFLVVARLARVDALEDAEPTEVRQADLEFPNSLCPRDEVFGLPRSPPFLYPRHLPSDSPSIARESIHAVRKACSVRGRNEFSSKLGDWMSFEILQRPLLVNIPVTTTCEEYITAYSISLFILLNILPIYYRRQLTIYTHDSPCISLTKAMLYYNEMCLLLDQSQLSN